jgi:ferrous iron transport protein A
MTLKNAAEGQEYIVKDVVVNDEELASFLFSLGCYAGEPIRVISQLKRSCIVAIKDAKYNIDHQLASAITV